MTDQQGECPCETCEDRRLDAISFGVHYYGDDCPDKCREYLHWRNGNLDLKKEGIPRDKNGQVSKG